MTPFSERYNYFINTCLSQSLLPENSAPSYEAVYEEINCKSLISIDDFKQMICGAIEPSSEVKYAISNLFGLNIDWMVKGSKTKQIFAQGMCADYNPLSILDFPNIKDNSIIIGLFFSGHIRYALVVIKESEFRYKYITPRFIFNLGEGEDTLSRTANFYRFIAQADARHLLYEQVYKIDENIANSIIDRTRHPADILKGTEIERFIYNLYYWDYDAWTIGYARSQSLSIYIKRVKKRVDELIQIDNNPSILSVVEDKRSARKYLSDSSETACDNNKDSRKKSVTGNISESFSHDTSKNLNAYNGGLYFQEWYEYCIKELVPKTITMMLSCLSTMAKRCVHHERKGEVELTADFEDTIKLGLENSGIHIAREYTMGRAIQAIGETDLYFYTCIDGVHRDLFILENKMLDQFVKQYEQLMGYLNAYFIAGFTLSINKDKGWEEAFDYIAEKLEELKKENGDFSPISIDRCKAAGRTNFIVSKHIIPETGGKMPVYHLVLQLSDNSRKSIAQKARKN